MTVPSLVKRTLFPFELSRCREETRSDAVSRDVHHGGRRGFPFLSERMLSGAGACGVALLLRGSCSPNCENRNQVQLEQEEFGVVADSEEEDEEEDGGNRHGGRCDGRLWRERGDFEATNRQSRVSMCGAAKCAASARHQRSGD